MALPEDSVWFYVPNKGTSAFVSALFGLLGVGMAYRAWQGHLSKFFWVQLMGILWEVAGFAVRAAAHDEVTDVALFAAPQSLIVLAPLWIAGGIYLICSRMIRAVDDRRRILLIHVRRLTPIFVTCDVVTLLIQVSGTTIASTDDWSGSTAKIGSDVLVAGVAIQTVTLLFFIAIIVRFAGKDLLMGRTQGAERRWLLGFRSAFFSSAMILLRCAYRLIEHATGIHGYLFTHEWNFYVFEALPMILAVGVLVAWYPPHFIPAATSDRRKEGLEAGQVGSTPL